MKHREGTPASLNRPSTFLLRTLYSPMRYHGLSLRTKRPRCMNLPHILCSQRVRHGWRPRLPHQRGRCPRGRLCTQLHQPLRRTCQPRMSCMPSSRWNRKTSRQRSSCTREPPPRCKCPLRMTCSLPPRRGCSPPQRSPSCTFQRRNSCSLSLVSSPLTYCICRPHRSCSRRVRRGWRPRLPHQRDRCPRGSLCNPRERREETPTSLHLCYTCPRGKLNSRRGRRDR